MFDGWPLLVAANRDEHYDRPSLPPHIWDTERAILAGKDLSAGGTWLGVNNHGLLVGILNRRSNGESGPNVQTRSRGLLCLDLLRRESVAGSLTFMHAQQNSYQPFTVLFADSASAYVAYNDQRRINAHELGPGLHVFSSISEFDGPSEKVDRAYGKFALIADELSLSVAAADQRMPALVKVLGDHSTANGASDPRDAICVHGEQSGTVSSTIISYSNISRRFEVFTSEGAPCSNPFGDALTLTVR
jgi:uncharacterized protein with NRDE domain